MAGHASPALFVYLTPQGNVFINQYLIIKDLGKGAHGTVKLVYNTHDEMLYAMKVRACARPEAWHCGLPTGRWHQLW